MKTKSITNLILSLLMLVALLPVLPQCVAAAEATPLIQNGDFEKIENGWPARWEKCCRPTDPHCTLETETVRSGETAVRIEAHDSYEPYTFQNVQGLMPGATYAFSVWANVNLKGKGNGAYFKIEFHGPGTSINSDDTMKDTDGSFQKLSFQFTVPEETNSVNILCRFQGVGGYVIFDDAELQLIRMPALFSFEFDDVFHYPHEEKGTVRVNLASFYIGKPQETEAKVDFELMDGDKVLHSVTDVHFINLKAEYSYDIKQFLTEKKKPYTIRATAKWNGEEEIFSQNVYVYDRPSIIGEDGVIRFGGKPFKPVMGYHIKDYTWDKIAEGGINVVQFGMGGGKNYTEAHLAECDRLLDILDENGMKALFILYDGMVPAASERNREFTKAYVERFKNDERIYAWAVMDEPFSANANPEGMRELVEESYTMIRNVDSMHPVHLTDVYSETAKYCDICTIDYYSLAEDNRLVYNFIDKNLKKIKGDCHMQYMGGTFTYSDYKKDVPSTKAIRGYIYSAFEAGVKGIGYFPVRDAVTYPDPEDSNKTIEIPLYDIELEGGFSWTDFSRLNKEEIPVLYDIYVHNKYKFMNESEGGRAPESAYWGTWTDGKIVYLIVHNKTSQTKTIEPFLGSENGLILIENGKIEKIGGTASSTISLSSPVFTMEPYEAALYKITPEEELDLTKLDKKNLLPNPSFETVTQGTPDGWSFGGDVDYRGVVSNAEEAFSGEKFIKLALGNCRINTYVPVRGNISYVLSVRYRATLESTGMFGIEYFVGDSPYKTYLTDKSLPYCTNIDEFNCSFGSDSVQLEWKTAEFIFTTPQYADKMRVQFWNNPSVNDPEFAIDLAALTETNSVPNLLPNGNFECFTDITNGTAASWFWASPQNTSGVNTAEIFTDKDGAILPKGESCLKFVSDSVQKTEKFPYMDFYLVPGSYTLSFRYRHESAESEAHAATIHLGDAIHYACPQEAGKWYDYSYTFTVTSGTAKNTLQIPGAGAIAGTYYFDDFVLLPAETGITLYEAYIGSENVNILKEQGTKLSALGKAESINGKRTVTVSAQYVPASESEEEVVLFVAVYTVKDGRKELVTLSNPLASTAKDGKPCMLYGTVSIPENTDDVAYNVECFLWRTADRMVMKPLMDKMVFS